jgi:hypothetical protein
MLKNLDEKVTDGHHRILVTSKREVMRGFDFRAKRFGICLIVDNAFDC